MLALHHTRPDCLLFCQSISSRAAASCADWMETSDGTLGRACYCDAGRKGDREVGRESKKAI